MVVPTPWRGLGLWDAGASLGGFRAAGGVCGTAAVSFRGSQPLKAERSLQQYCSVGCSSQELQRNLFVRREEKEGKKKKKEPAEFENKL